MYSTGDYPLGAKEDSRAPYNQPLEEDVIKEVCVSCTYHRYMKVKAKEYCDNYDLERAVRERLSEEGFFRYMEDKGFMEDELEAIEE